MVVVAVGEGIVDVVDHRGVRDAREQGVAPSDVGLQRCIGIDVMLAEGELAVGNVLAHGGKVVANVGLHDTDR